MADRFREAFWDGEHDASLRFSRLCSYLVRLGCRERIRGSHHMFTRDGVPEILNLQPQGSRCKSYPVKQVRKVLERHGFR